MDDQAQIAWLASAIDALQGITVQEVAAVSVELRRFVTRPAQIVPKIAELVAAKRRNTVSSGSLDQINRERVKEGLGAIRWVKRDGRTVCEFVDPPERSIEMRVK